MDIEIGASKEETKFNKEVHKFSSINDKPAFSTTIGT